MNAVNNDYTISALHRDYKKIVPFINAEKDGRKLFYNEKVVSIDKSRSDIVKYENDDVSFQPNWDDMKMESYSDMIQRRQDEFIKKYWGKNTIYTFKKPLTVDNWQKVYDELKTMYPDSITYPEKNAAKPFGSAKGNGKVPFVYCLYFEIAYRNDGMRIISWNACIDVPMSDIKKMVDMYSYVANKNFGFVIQDGNKFFNV